MLKDLHARFAIIFCIWLLILFIPTFCFSQPLSGNKEIDRLNKLAYKLVYDESKSDSLFLVGSQMKTIGNKTGNEIGILYGQRFCGLSLINKGEFENALKETFTYLELTKKFNRPEEQLKAFGDMGNIYMQINRYQEAKKYYLEPTKNQNLIASNPRRASAFFTNLGVVYKREQKLDSALMMYEKSIELKSIAKDTLGILSVNGNLAVLYADLGQFTKGRKLFETNIELARKYQNEGDLWYNLSGLGHLLIKAKKIDEAQLYLNEALELANKIKSKTYQYQTYDLLAESHKTAKQYEKALNAYTKARVLAESVLNEKTNNEIMKLREQFNTEEKENENILLNQELQIQRTRQLLLGGGIGVLVLVSILAVFAWRKNEKKNAQITIQKNEIEVLNASLEKKIEKRTSELQLALEEVKEASTLGQQKERKRLASDLHDNLGSVLSAISMNLEALDPKALNEREQKLYANIKAMTSDAYNEVRLISHNLSPKELEKEGGLKTAIERLVIKLNTAQKTSFTLDFNLTQKLSQRIEVNLYAIVLELSNNVLRHASAKSAKIELSAIDNMLQLSVTDDGGGFTKQYYSGMGLSSIQARIEELHGNLFIGNEKGGKVEIAIPLET